MVKYDTALRFARKKAWRGNMKDFAYVARDISGKQQNGFSRAAGKNDVLVWLREQGLMPVQPHRTANPKECFAEKKSSR